MIEKKTGEHHYHQESPERKYFQIKGIPNEQQASYSNDQFNSDMDNSRMQEQVQSRMT